MKVELSKSIGRKCTYRRAGRRPIRMKSLAELSVARALDTAEVQWWYEPHVMAVGGSTWYRPDFLVELDDGQLIWIEVKGPEPTRIERWKCRRLATVSNKDVYIVWDSGSSCLLFRAGGGFGEEVGGLCM